MNHDSQLIKPDSSPILLMDLNDHCLIEIFQYASLQSLCNVAEVCKRFQQLAITAFKSKWKNRVVNLHSLSDWKARSDALRILHHFGDLLDKVDVKTNEKKFFDIILERCGPNLIEVKFSSVHFCGRILNRENIAKFINLRSLRFGYDICDAIDPACIEQNFSHLEHFAMHYLPCPYFKNLKEFIILNPQLRRLGLAPDQSQFSFSRDVMHFIDQNLPQLEELEITVLDIVDGYEEIDSAIVYESIFFKNLKRLIFEHCLQTDYWLRYLSISNENVEEMHFNVNHSKGWNNFIDTIGKHYKQVKKLKFNFLLDDEELTKLSENMPKLAVVECHDKTYRRDRTHKLVQGSPRFIRNN